MVLLDMYKDTHKYTSKKKPYTDVFKFVSTLPAH